MNALNKPIITLIVGIMFTALAVKSCEQKQATNQQADAFIAKQLAKYKTPRPISREEALYSVWGLTQADVAKPVDIFAENKRR